MRWQMPDYAGLDVQISQVLVKFQEFAAGHIPLAAMVDTVIAVMDHPVMPFSQPGLRSPNAMLIDLLMYEESSGCSGAVLICGNSYSAGDFLEELEKVTLLTEQQDALMSGPQLVVRQQQLKSDVAQMSKILYSFENWSCEDSWKLLLVVRTCKDVVAVDVLTVDLVAASFLMGMGTMMLCLMVPPVQDEFSISDRKPLNELEEIGKRLQKACSGNAPASGRMVQDMLIHTDFVSIAGYWLMLDWQDTNPESRLLHRRLTAIVCSIATAFCRNNPKNQGVFMDFLPGLSKDDFPESAALVAEIFRGNLTNCEQVPEELIEDFGNQMVRTKRAGRYVPWYTFFFSSIASMLQCLRHGCLSVTAALLTRPTICRPAPAILDHGTSDVRHGCDAVGHLLWPGGETTGEHGEEFRSGTRPARVSPQDVQHLKDSLGARPFAVVARVDHLPCKEQDMGFQEVAATNALEACNGVSDTKLFL
eukprot:s1331_g1.t1